MTLIIGYLLLTPIAVITLGWIIWVLSGEDDDGVDVSGYIAGLIILAIWGIVLIQL